ncbi:hypothetical protein K8I28_07485, partial [bacterium]|nr:hypothetical protein [bacterium]
MKKLPLVLAVGLLLVLASVSFSANQPVNVDKDALARQVDDAYRALDAGQQLTPAQKQAIEAWADL